MIPTYHISSVLFALGPCASRVLMLLFLSRHFVQHSSLDLLPLPLQQGKADLVIFQVLDGLKMKL